jgi:hypothetical protein
MTTIWGAPTRSIWTTSVTSLTKDLDGGAEPETEDWSARQHT